MPPRALRARPRRLHRTLDPDRIRRLRRERATRTPSSSRAVAHVRRPARRRSATSRRRSRTRQRPSSSTTRCDHRRSPVLADCNMTYASSAAPPAAIAVDAAIDLAVRHRHRRSAHAKAELSDLAKRADQIGWAPLTTRAHFDSPNAERSVGARTRRAHRGRRARDASHLDREAERAWASAAARRWPEHATGAIGALSAIARPRPRAPAIIGSSSRRRSRAVSRRRARANGRTAQRCVGQCSPSSSTTTTRCSSRMRATVCSKRSFRSARGPRSSR